MAYSYSLGVIFEKESEALAFKREFEKQKISSSDSKIIPTSIYITKTAYDSNEIQQFAVSCFVNDLRYPGGNEELFSRPKFYDIRNYFYDYMLNTDIDFISAFYELEGADKILTDEIATELNENGIGEIQEGDVNASYCSENLPEYYYSKRILDGLIISHSVYVKLSTDFPEFKKFKRGYYWLPLKEYKK